MTRYGNPRTVFQGGQSDLLNHVAQLSVLYEDLRLEMLEFRNLHARLVAEGGSDPDREYRTLYFVRRALATLVEFRSGRSEACRTREFKQGKERLSP